MKKVFSLFCASFILTGILLAGEGGYFEFKMASNEGNISGTIKSYSMSGNSRTETDFQVSNMPQGGGIHNVSLILKDSPGKIMMLNTTDKTYNEIENRNAARSTDDYEVTVLGKEKINGYNCTHVNVKAKSSNTIQEMWTSEDVKDYNYYRSVNNKYMGGDNLFKALEAKGAAGFPVRIKMQERGKDMQMDLVKIERRDVDATLFSLDGYKKSGGGPAGNSQQEMMQKFQSMTPEERQKYIEQLKSQQPH